MSTIQFILAAGACPGAIHMSVTITVCAATNGGGARAAVSIAVASQLNEPQARKAFSSFNHDENTQSPDDSQRVVQPERRRRVLKNGDVIQDSNSAK